METLKLVWRSITKFSFPVCRSNSWISAPSLAMGFSNKDGHRHAGDYETDMYTGITTYHGLVRIYNAKSCSSRCFWISIVLIAYTTFIFQVYRVPLLTRAIRKSTEPHYPRFGGGRDSLQIWRFVKYDRHHARGLRNENNLQASSLLAAYHERPTKYESNVVVPIGGIEFPSVTICNFSPVKVGDLSCLH